MRILFVTGTRWSRNLGASRVLIELGDELARAGHEVAKFSFEDAFPSEARLVPRRLRLYWSSYRSVFGFPRRALAFVRKHGGGFDVIDAMHCELPFSKGRLGFDGLLVARSVALVPAYLDFDRFASRRWPSQRSPVELAQSIISYPPYRRRLGQVGPSFRHADLINVSNTDDLERLRSGPLPAEKVVHFSLGISEERFRALGDAALPAETRLTRPTVAFVGTWNPRKGSRDWPAIAARLSEEVPDCRFRLLGTSLPEDSVLRALPPRVRDRTRVIAAFDTEALPNLLADATVGVFPSYCEGFGIAVLEKLASGLPCVAYDAPGPRDVLSELPGSALVPAGDTAALATAAAAILTADPIAYRSHSQRARERVRRFFWSGIADATARRYLGELQRIRGARGTAESRRAGGST